MEECLIVTVVNTIAVTSMPINEFALYRHRLFCTRQAIISCEQPHNAVAISDEISVFFVENEYKEMRKAVKKIEEIAKEYGCKAVYHLHQQKSALLFFRAIGLKYRLRTLFSVHSTYALRSSKYKLESVICSLLACKVTCVSKAGFDGYSRIIKAIKKKNVQMIRNGVDFERIQAAVQGCEKRQERQKRLVSVGRIIPIKNQYFLVDVMKELPDDCRLLLIGRDESQGELQRMIDKVGLHDRIELTGQIDRESVFKIIAECGIYVSASHVEGMPISVLEAMSVGILPVLSDISPHAEIADDCAGVTVLPLDVHLWVQTISRIMEMPVHEFAQRCEALSKETEDKYSLLKMHRAYNRLYEEM